MAVKITLIEEKIATVIAEFNGRTSVMTNQLGIHPLAAKRVFKAVHGIPPKSGLLPSSTDTNFMPIPRLHSSILVNSYDVMLADLVKKNPDHEILQKYHTGELNNLTEARVSALEKSVKIDKALAFVSAYKTYSSIVPEESRAIDINRFDFLIKDLYRTSNIKMPKKIIQWARCRICRSKILRKFDETNTKCPQCEGSLERSRMMLDAFSRRSVRRTDEIINS